MHSLRLTRSYLNHFNLNFFDKSSSSFLNARKLAVERLFNVAKRSMVGDSDGQSADVFGTLSPKTEEQATRKWNSKLSKPIRYRSKLKADPESDKFGLLDPSPQVEPEGDEGDFLDEKTANVRRPVRWKTPDSYGRDMRQLILQNKLADALTLYKKMLEVDMVKPDAFVYNVLIGGCGKYGFTSMAFKLYTAMKERGIEVHGPTWSGLFNSCGNCPFPKYGLKHAHHLYNSITQKGIAMNERNYHAAIKAFGRCGDLQMAFRLVDEMVEKQVVVSTETFNFLLMGCASDKKSGFLQAIMVWRKMQEKRIQPDTFSYSLLLRVTRDCGLGDIKLAQPLLLQSKPNMQLQETSEKHQLQTESQTYLTKSLSVTNQLQSQLPDILSPRCQQGSVMKIIEPKTPQDRLALLGGMDGLLARMSQDRAKPALKTFTQLLELIPSDPIYEENLLKEMRKLKIEFDVDFYNVLIKKRNWRQDFNGAKEVLALIAQDHLYPDIATFGTLAIGCHNFKLGQQLLEDIKNAGFRPNIEIMGALVQQACYHRNFWYVIEMLKVIQKEEIKPSPKLIDILEKCVTSTKENLVKKEREGVRFAPDDPFVKSFQKFLMVYKIWLQDCEMQMPDDPWSSYRPPSNIDEVINSDIKTGTPM